MFLHLLMPILSRIWHEKYSKENIPKKIFRRKYSSESNSEESSPRHLQKNLGTGTRTKGFLIVMKFKYNTIFALSLQYVVLNLWKNQIEN